MKHLTKSLLIAFLAFSLVFSCGGDASLDSSNETTTITKGGKNLRNPTDNLSKEEKIARMEKANGPKYGSDLSSNEEKVKAIRADIKSQSRLLGEGQAEQASMNRRKRYEEQKDTPTTSEQINVANRICDCLKKEDLFDAVRKTKSKEALFKLAGENSDKTIQAMQDCYTVNMVPAVKNLGDDSYIFAIKSRNYLNEKCIKGTDDFWLNIGTYLSRKNKPVDVEIDMTKEQ